MEKLLAILLLIHYTSSYAVTQVFTEDEVKECVRFRSPESFTVPPSSAGGNPTVHVIARCCGPNLCSSKGLAYGLGDNDGDDKIVMKSSNDFGSTWTNFQTLSPGDKTGYAGGSAIYDSVRQRIVAQYQYIPAGSTKPAENVEYYQITSTDNGQTWSDPVDLTSQIAPCSTTENMFVSSAGSKVQALNGRLLWPAHDQGGTGIVWYSDDGGDTYTCTAPIVARELSIAIDPSSTNSERIYMNGRGMQFEPNRSQYWSEDNGTTWSAPEKSELLDDHGGCERSLRYFKGMLYSCEPQSKGRQNAVCACSLDGGNTWPHSYNVGDGASSGYSALEVFDQGLLLIEEDKELNFKVSFHSTEWCPTTTPSLRGA